MLRRTIPLATIHYTGLQGRVLSLSLSVLKERRAYCSNTDKGANRPELPKRIKIYTRTGDKGISSLFTGERRPKDDILFSALGDCDELNSFIGLSREYCVQSNISLAKELEDVQCMLQEAASSIATPRHSLSLRSAKLHRTSFRGEYIKKMEDWIDSMDRELSPLTQFILPSGGKCATHLHVARAVCRRLERQIVSLIRVGEVEDDIGRFINRLSDALFTAARYVSMKDIKPETCYKANRGRTSTREF